MKIRTRKLVDHFMGGRRTTYETGIEFDDDLILTTGGSTKEGSEADFKKMIVELAVDLGRRKFILAADGRTILCCRYPYGYDILRFEDGKLVECGSVNTGDNWNDLIEATQRHADSYRDQK